MRAAWDARAKGAALQADWNALFAAYRAAYTDLAAEFVRRTAGDLLPDLLRFARIDRSALPPA